MTLVYILLGLILVYTNYKIAKLTIAVSQEFKRNNETLGKLQDGIESLGRDLDELKRR